MIIAHSHTHIHTHIYLPNPSSWGGGNTRLNFKRSLTGLNSEFSFFKTGYHTKVKESNLPYYLPIAGRRTIGFVPFQKILAQYEMLRPGFELFSPCQFPTILTITSRANPWIYIYIYICVCVCLFVLKS